MRLKILKRMEINGGKMHPQHLCKDESLGVQHLSHMKKNVTNIKDTSVTNRVTSKYR